MIGYSMRKIVALLNKYVIRGEPIRASGDRRIARHLANFLQPPPHLVPSFRVAIDIFNCSSCTPAHHAHSKTF